MYVDECNIFDCFERPRLYCTFDQNVESSHHHNMNVKLEKKENITSFLHLFFFLDKTLSHGK